MALETISHMTQNGRNGHRRTRFFLTKSSGNKNIGNNILQKQKNLNKYLCHTNVEHCLTLSIVWPLLEDQQPVSLHKLVLWIIVPTGKSFINVLLNAVLSANCAGNSKVLDKLHDKSHDKEPEVSGDL